MTWTLREDDARVREVWLEKEAPTVSYARMPDAILAAESREGETDAVQKIDRTS